MHLKKGKFPDIPSNGNFLEKIAFLQASLPSHFSLVVRFNFDYIYQKEGLLEV